MAGPKHPTKNPDNLEGKGKIQIFCGVLLSLSSWKLLQNMTWNAPPADPSKLRSWGEVWQTHCQGMLTVQSGEYALREVKPTHIISLLGPSWLMIWKISNVRVSQGFQEWLLPGEQPAAGSPCHGPQQEGFSSKHSTCGRWVAQVSAGLLLIS